MRPLRLPGIIGYVSIALWFLLMVMSAPPAKADIIGNNVAAIENKIVAITAADILPAIEQALTDQGVSSEAQISLTDPATEIDVIAGVAPIFQSVSYNNSSGRFVIRVQGAPGSSPVLIAGSAFTAKKIAVLTRDFARGETISESDIQLIEATDPRQANFAADSYELIGMETRRPLRAGAPIRQTDIQTPVLVEKGEVVTMILASAGLKLSHSGVAMRSGGEGDLIPIKNIKSDRTVKAVVVAERLAEVPWGNHRLN